MTILEARKLSKSYGAGATLVTALEDASLVVQKGEFVAIMGPSGSGKSTLLHLLGGLDNPSSGDIIIHDTNVAGLSDRQLTLLRREKVGFVFQFFNLLPTLTAEENIALPLVIAGRKKREYGARLEELLKLVGLVSRRRHRPDELSGGEQQRVAIARALITEPAIVLADEPTGNLDSKNGRDILALLKKSSTELSQTVLMVTHDPTAAAYADRVVFLRDGRIVREMALGGVNDSEAIMAGLKELED